jgi:hypothetical protein
VVLGINQAIHSGAHPHPFLPNLTITGPLLTAIRRWALAAWLGYALVGLLCGILLFAAWVLQRGEGPSARPLGFRRGLWQGAGAALVVHALLFWEVPAALATLPLLGRLPMGLVLLAGLALAGYCLGRGFQAARRLSDWGRLLGGCLLLVLLLHAPHDLFRRSMPRPPVVDPGASRTLVFSIDGCRQDVLEKAAPELKAPAGVVPVVAIPATRLAWNLLLGAPPDTMTHGFVIPQEWEWYQASPATLLERTSEKGLSTCFLIDDSTTLSFGLTRAKFTEVLEPAGGWTHYFSVGAGACWPVYSWLENFLSPVETTNPWADFAAFNRDVGRALERHRLVFSHTCQLHAPFFARREELQVLRPWRWLLHSAYAYQSYQALGEAEVTHYDRQDGRSNPKNSYRIRLERLIRLTRPAFTAWTARFPALSGVLTADHGEAFLPIITADGTLVNYFTGVHGFNLTPETLLVPLYPFGATRTQDLKPGPFSWFDLRQCLKDWVEKPEALSLKQIKPEGWLLSAPSIQMVHTQGAADQPRSASAGLTPATLARHAMLSDAGIWFMTGAVEGADHPISGHALIAGQDIVTFNPVGGGEWAREVWKGYDLQGGSNRTTEQMEQELAAFPGKRPEQVFPPSPPTPGGTARGGGLPPTP